MASSYIVVKVNYEDTLRRFNANLNGDEQLDLDIEGLNAKIRSLFNFTSDVELRLTYMDEDHDMVALVDDNDLCDVVRQDLNPLRINVQLNTGKMGPSSVQSSIMSTPSRSQVHNSTLNINSGVADLLKSVPEPFREILAKMSLEMASKAASSAPVSAKLIDSFAKKGQSVLNSHFQSQSAPTDSTVCKEAGEGGFESSAGKDVSGPKDAHTKLDGSVPASDSSQKPHLGKDNSSSCFPILSSKLNKEALSSSFPNKSSAETSANPGKLQSSGGKKTQALHSSEGASSGVGFYLSPFGTSAQDDCCSKGTATDSAVPKKHTERTFSYAEPSRQNGLKKLNPIATDSAVPKKHTEHTFSYAEPSRQNGLKKLNPIARPCLPSPIDPLVPPAYHLSRSFNGVDNLGTQCTIFHRGVRCDGCGVLPITGPRFKSKVKDDYDLCQICFAQIGNDSDYLRIDFPALHWHPWSFKGYSDERFQRFGSPFQPRNFQPRLESRFILDVNIIDGTIMAPKTPFTKIWRMRNSGTLPWTHGTQLVWIGGDKFADTDSVEIEIAFTGLGVEEELDVAVDFVAPELPGRYISYWRMASPTGQKFGQRVWVLIQVDASLNDMALGAPPTQTQSLNLNMPPENTNQNLQPEQVVDNVDPLVDIGFEACNVSSSAPPVPILEHNNATLLKERQQQNNFPGPKLPFHWIDDTVLTPAGSHPCPLGPDPPALSQTTTSQPAPLEPRVLNLPPANAWTVSYPPIEADLLGVAPTLATSSTAPSYPTIDAPIHPTVATASSSQAGKGEAERSNNDGDNEGRNNSNNVNEVEKALVNELVEMGFDKVYLNKEVLRKNNYDLEKSLDDLCAYADWDLLLEELRGMGFGDEEMNRKVLMKNNGSLKHAVMDLVTRENA